MSKVTKPVAIPTGVEVSRNGQEISVKGSKGQLSLNMHSFVDMKQEDGNVSFDPVFSY